MYVQLVQIRVKPGRVSDFLDAFRINFEGTLQEEGNVQFDLLQSRDDDHCFYVYEVFKSADALAVHRQTDHFKTCVGQFNELLDGERSITRLVPVMTQYD